MPPFDVSKRLGWCLLAQEPFNLIAPLQYAGRTAHDLLKSEPLIRYSRDSWDSQAIDDYLKCLGVIPRERLELSSTESITMMVDQGLGIAIVPSVWTLWQSRVNVLALELPEPTPTRRFGLIWNRSSLKLQLVSVFRQVAEREYQR
jgi:DNA-binding transcriptional LysR family regulator